MGLSLHVGKKEYEIGTASFLKSFFSTVFVKLEEMNWGSVYPTIMRELYTGQLKYFNSEAAIRELISIQKQFELLPPTEIVWDFENSQAEPPWREKVNPEINSLANYFWTSDGNNLLRVLMKSFKESKDKECDIFIK